MRKTLIILFILTAIGVHAQYYPAANDWKTISPREAGFNSDKLSDAIEFAKSNEYSGEKDLRMAILRSFSREPYHEIVGPTKERGGPAGMIIKNGFVVAEWGDTERVDMTFSVTKSYLSTVAGLAWDRGMFQTEDKVGDLVWDGTFEGEHNSRITWHHLLNQSSDWSGQLFGMYDWADRPPREGGIDDWRNRQLYEPGTHYKYNDVRVNVLAYSLLQVWRKPLPQVIKEQVMDRIGASSTWRWYGYSSSWVNVDGVKVQSVSGGGHSGGGFFISTLDHARFGLLFARKGNWNGVQLVSQDWITKATTSSEANEQYGYLWWLNKGAGKWEGWGDHVYNAAGFGGNFIIIDDEQDLVVVLRWLEPSKLGEMMEKLAAAMD